MVRDFHDPNPTNPIQAQWHELGGQEHCFNGEKNLLSARQVISSKFTHWIT